MIWRVVTLECIIVNLKYKCLPNEVQQFVNLAVYHLYHSYPWPDSRALDEIFIEAFNA